MFFKESSYFVQKAIHCLIDFNNVPPTRAWHSLLGLFMGLLLAASPLLSAQLVGFLSFPSARTWQSPAPAFLCPPSPGNPLSFNIPRVTLDCSLNAAPIQKVSELLREAEIT